MLCLLSSCLLLLRFSLGLFFFIDRVELGFILRILIIIVILFFIRSCSHISLILGLFLGISVTERLLILLRFWLFALWSCNLVDISEATWAVIIVLRILFSHSVHLFNSLLCLGLGSSLLTLMEALFFINCIIIVFVKLRLVLFISLFFAIWLNHFIISLIKALRFCGTQALILLRIG